MKDAKFILEDNREKIVNSYKEGKSSTAIAKELGINSGSVYVFLRDVCKVKMKEVPNIEIYKDNIEKLCSLNYTQSEICKQLGIKGSTLSRYMKKLGLKTGKFQKKGYVNKLENNKENVIRDYNNGLGCTRLSKKYKVSEVSVSKFLRKNVDNPQKNLIKRSFNEKYLDNIDCEEKAYTYGYIIGDGCNSKNTLQITSIDKEILEKFKKLFEYDGDLNITNSSEYNNKTQYRLQLCSKYLSNRLTEIYCMPKKTFKTRFPGKEILPENLIRHFIRGLVDSDGWVHFDKQDRHRISISGTRPLLEGIQEYLKGINIQTNIYKHSSIFILRCQKHNEVINLAKHLYHDCSLSLDRKQKLADEIIIRNYI